MYDLLRWPLQGEELMGDMDWVEVGNAVASAQVAAEAQLRAAGIEPTAVVVNVAWEEGGGEWAAGSRINASAPLLAESLRQSAEEADAT